MQQLSRPYLIALGALLVFALAWFAFLKPSDDAEALAPVAAAIATPSSAPAVPGAAGLGRAVDKANAVAAAAKASKVAGAEEAAVAPVAQSARTAPATGATGPAEPVSAAPAADPSSPILRDLAAGKVAVLLFYTPKAAEDRAVRRALTNVDRHAGKVVVRGASIARVADYAAITEGVDILQSPTVLVIGRDRSARALVGYTDTRAINQLVADVGGGAFAPRRFKGYRGTIENLCAVTAQSVAGTVLNASDAAEAFTLLRGDVVDARRTVRKLDPPKRYQAFHRRLLRNLDLGVTVASAALAAIEKGEDGRAAAEAFQPRIAASEARVDAAAKRAGIASDC